LNGIFVLQWTDDGYVIKGKFWQDGEASVIDNILMRIALSHEPKKEFSTVATQKDTFIYSRLFEFRDAKKALQKIIVGVELAKGENQDDYKKFLIEACKSMPENLTKSQAELEQILTATFASQTGIVTEQTGDMGKDLYTRLKERAKVLMNDGKIDEATDLLERAKTVPGSLQKLIEKGTKLIKQQKIDDAQKVYAEAIELAVSIEEGDLAGRLQDELTRASERPRVIEQILDIETKAKKALRDENVKRAAELYKDAAQLAVKLNDVDAMNEFTKKSQSLFDFYTADQKKKRSF